MVGKQWQREENRPKADNLGVGSGVVPFARVIISVVEYPFPPVGIVGAANGINSPRFFCLPRDQKDPNRAVQYSTEWNVVSTTSR